eukprot:scaffold16935_cov18-Tisochrysis_lutea.AAC.3
MQALQGERTLQRVHIERCKRCRESAHCKKRTLRDACVAERAHSAGWCCGEHELKCMHVQAHLQVAAMCLHRRLLDGHGM